MTGQDCSDDHWVSNLLSQVPLEEPPSAISEFLLAEARAAVADAAPTVPTRSRRWPWAVAAIVVISAVAWLIL